MKILVVSNKNSKCVSLIPKDVNKLVTNGIQVYVTNNTTNLCDYSINDYINAGAEIIDKLTPEFIKTINILSFVDFPKDKKIIKLLSPSQILWGFMYLVNNPKNLFLALKKGLTTIAIETINSKNVYEYLLPIEQIKGENILALIEKQIKEYKNSQDYAKKMKKRSQAKSPENNVLILNYSYSGYYVAKSALASGYNVTYLENDATLAHELKTTKELQKLADSHKCHFNVIEANYDNLCDKVKDANIFIVTSQFPTIKTSLRITKDMVASMPLGSAYVNLAAETGFASITEIKPTIINKPSTVFNGVNHINIEDMYDMLPKQASEIISNLNTKNFLEIATNLKADKLILSDNKFKNAIMTYNHCLTNKEIASSLHLKYTNIDSIKRYNMTTLMNGGE